MLGASHSVGPKGNVRNHICNLQRARGQLVFWTFILGPRYFGELFIQFILTTPADEKICQTITSIQVMFRNRQRNEKFKSVFQKQVYLFELNFQIKTNIFIAHLYFSILS
jgi:hypothetical protein